MAKLLIIADITPSSGLGHWMRCYNLSRSLQVNNIDIHALRSPFMNSFDFFMPTDFIHWHSTTTELNHIEIAKLVEILNEANQFDAILIDGYHFDATYRQQLHNIGVQIIAYDDTNNCSNYHCDVLINANPNSKQLSYDKTAPDAELLLGHQYRLFATEYYAANAQQVTKSNWSDRNCLTLIMGGGDSHSLTLPLLQTLIELDWQDQVPELHVVTTAMHANHAMIHRWCERNRIQDMRIHVHHQMYNLAPLFTSSKLVISGAGGSAYELQMCATPAMLISLADNQIATAIEAKKMGWADCWDWQENPDIAALAKAIRSTWLDEQSLMSKHNKLTFDHKLFAQNNLSDELINILEVCTND